jgi:type IV pilus assembly protein PilQ
MMTQRTKSAVFAMAGAIMCLPSSAFAKAAGSVVIDRIETRSAGAGREIVIHTSKEPTFSVFRLSDPIRVLVDVNDARMERPIDLMKIKDGVLRYISTNTFADESSAIVRVEIALEQQAEYRVRAEGSSIIVTLEGAATNEKAASPVRLGAMTKRASKENAKLVAALESGAVDHSAIKIEQLDNPPRLVVDIANAEANPKYQKLEVGKFGVKRARVASESGSVRVVLDVDGANVPALDVQTADGRLELVLAAPETRKAAETAKVELEAAPAAKTEPVQQAAAPAPAPQPKAAPIRVTDVRFEPRDGFVRLTMVLDSEKVNVEKLSTAEGPSLRIANADLPATLERTLDVSEVAGEVVSAISTYRDGTDTIISAAIGQGTEHRHWRKDNKLIWDFRAANSLAQNSDAARVLPYPEQATSGYSSAAIQLTGTLAPEQKYKGRRISLDLKDADIQNVLRLLADVSKLNIVAADDVRGRVTIKLRNVPWDQALDIILRSKQLDKTRSGNILRVAPIDVLRKEEEIRLERAKQRVELEPLSVRLIPVSYAVATEIRPQVTALLSTRCKVNIDTRTNVLVVEDIPEVLLKVERLVRTLDTQTPQVLIEARIVEANTNFSRQLGIQWGGQVSATQQFGTSTGLGFPNQVRISGASDDGQANVTEGVVEDPNYAVNLPVPIGSGAGGGLGFIFGSAGGAAIISLRLSAAERTGKAKIISAPKIVTLDNKEARILSGEKVPITVLTANGPSTRFIDANIELAVTPHVTQDGSILLNINAKKNQLSDRRDLLGTPGILTKEAVTEMLVRDGDTAVLGGLYQRNANEIKSYVPWIGQVPVLGWLFKTTSRVDDRSELLIFVSPRIVNRSQALVSVQ